MSLGFTCPSCNGVIGRDCFNPQECMAITQDQAARYREQSQAESNCDQCEAALIQCQGEIQYLNERIEAMNAVFGEIRMAIGGNTFSQELHPEDFDPESPWLPVGLLMKIDSVMTREHRR